MTTRLYTGAKSSRLCSWRPKFSLRSKVCGGRYWLERTCNGVFMLEILCPVSLSQGFTFLTDRVLTVPLFGHFNENFNFS